MLLLFSISIGMLASLSLMPFYTLNEREKMMCENADCVHWALTDRKQPGPSGGKRGRWRLAFLIRAAGGAVALGGTGRKGWLPGNVDTMS